MRVYVLECVCVCVCECICLFEYVCCVGGVCESVCGGMCVGVWWGGVYSYVS